jgi:hypothetical protein
MGYGVAVVVKSSKGAFVSISHWAVGRLPETTQVAIKLGNFPPILISVDNAKEIAAALKSEADAVSCTPAVVPPSRTKTKPR